MTRCRRDNANVEYVTTASSDILPLIVFTHIKCHWLLAVIRDKRSLLCKSVIVQLILYINQLRLSTTGIYYCIILSDSIQYNVKNTLCQCEYYELNRFVNVNDFITKYIICMYNVVVLTLQYLCYCHYISI